MYFDKESGIHYNYFRDYEPQTGRYLESDPIGQRGGLNTFGYTDANPLRFFDENGLLKCNGSWKVKSSSLNLPVIAWRCTCYWMCVSCKVNPQSHFPESDLGLPSTNGWAIYSGTNVRKPLDCICSKKPGTETGCTTCDI